MNGGAPAPIRSRCTAWWHLGCPCCAATATAALRSGTRSITCSHCRCAGAVAVLAVLLGSTAFDSFSATPQWRVFVDDHTDSAATATLLRTAGLLVFAAVVAGTFWLAARATGGVDAQRRRVLPGLMAHSLIPIVIGYLFAHYLTYLVERGQQTILLLFGLGDAQVHYVLSMHPSLLAPVPASKRYRRTLIMTNGKRRPPRGAASQITLPTDHTQHNGFHLRAALDSLGGSMTQWTVMSDASDPFRMDSRPTTPTANGCATPWPGRASRK